MNPIVSKEYYDENYINSFNGIVAWLLYSDMDTPFAAYVKTNWDALDMMSGDHCLITVIDNKTNDANRFWNDLHVSNNSRHLNFKPYDKNTHVKIADELGIDYTNMPCIVFYEKTDSKEHVVYSFSNDWSQQHTSEHFKEIFSKIKKILKTNTPEFVSEQLETDFKMIQAKKFVSRNVSKIPIGTIISNIGKALV
ncbi:hypothetical protein [uncultured Sulfuricurvum sp.]|uniref:hypothetical protein n=1 Tax=uncultured Sulfuricurvum sp. TaxID=430693 RepID=UPI0026394E10|nr:hypothetical protein [uncultured Sulfuricurvum sp.]